MNNSVLTFFSYRSHKSGYIERLFSILSQAAAGKNIQLERGSLKDIQIYIQQNNMTVRESLTNKLLTDFKLVYFELWSKAPQQALAVALFCDRRSVPFFSRELLKIPAISKVGAMATLADNNISLPDTYMTSNRELRTVFEKNPPMAYPLIVKSSIGFGGKDNYLVKDYAALCKVLDDNPKLEFIVQEFIPNICDYRCLVMGGKIVLVLKRTRQAAGHSHLNNTSQGADGTVVPLNVISKLAQEQVLRAAKLIDRADFCGVDLIMHSKTNQPYILEVNEAPQIEIGVATDQKMNALLDYMQQRINGAQK